MAVKDNCVHQLISEFIMFVKSNFSNFKTNLTVNRQLSIILRRINRKTALLIQLSTEVGAITSQSDKDNLRKLKMIINTSFQIIDDVLECPQVPKKLVSWSEVICLMVILRYRFY